MHPLEQKALEFATAAHQKVGQLRKYTGEPYIVHPIAVADIVRTVPHTPEMVATAYLHDTVEDTEATHADIEKEFGVEIGRYVWFLTDTDRSYGTRAVRKRVDTLRLMAAPAAVKTIKLADLIHNTETIVQYDPKFAETYLAEKRNVLFALRGEGDPVLVDRAWAILRDSESKIFNKGGR